MPARTTICLAALVLAALPLLPTSGRADTPMTYARCMAMVRSKPDAAFDAAVSWQGLGGGDAAEHCAGAALIGMGEHAEGARRLEALAQRLHADSSVRAELLAQAAQGWLLDNDIERAESVLNAAIGLAPKDGQLYVDRASVRAQRKDYEAAADDLDEAIALDPYDADALALRASARRQLNDKEGALWDAEEALRVDGNNTAALLERGILRQTDGDSAGARQDWLKILQVSPDGPVGDAARAEIEKLDVHVGGGKPAPRR
jgi:tetratricopeptide (TPR) repeat protein